MNPEGNSNEEPGRMSTDITGVAQILWGSTMTVILSLPTIDY